MARPLCHEDYVGFRLSRAAHRALTTAALSLNISKSELVRAIVLQALRNEPIARAATEGLDRPAYPQFTADLS